MEKNELIQSILQFNSSTSAAFLARFSEPDLQAYLERISLVCTPSTKPLAAKLPRVRHGHRRLGLMGRLFTAARIYRTHLLAPRRIHIG